MEMNELIKKSSAMFNDMIEDADRLVIIISELYLKTKKDKKTWYALSIEYIDKKYSGHNLNIRRIPVNNGIPFEEYCSLDLKRTISKPTPLGSIFMGEDRPYAIFIPNPSMEPKDLTVLQCANRLAIQTIFGFALIVYGNESEKYND